MLNSNAKITLLFIFFLSAAGSLYPMQQASKLAAQIAQNPTVAHVAPGLAFGTGVGTACYLLIRHRGTMCQWATTGWNRLFGRYPQSVAAQQAEPSTTIHKLPANVLEEIAGYLPAADIANVRLSCTDMAQRFWSQDMIINTECLTENDLPAIKTLSATYPRNELNVRTYPALLKHLAPMKKIATLRFIRQFLADLPQEMVQFNNLTGLSLSMSNLQNNAIVQIIALCSRLKNLNLSYTNTKSIPAEIEQLKDLTELNLYACDEFGNSIDIPLETSLKNICKIKNLITLNLGCAKELYKLVPEFANLSKLKVLNLRGPGLATRALLPLKDLKLEELDVNQLQISDNLGCIPQITSLQKLNLGNTNLSIERIEEIAQSLDNLTELTMASTKTAALPPSFPRLARLTKLDLSDNPLTPQALSIVCAMTNLRSLDINNCKLSELPDQIANLKHLTTLIASSNALTTKSLQTIAVALKKLEKLDIYNNKIDALPEQMATMTTMHSLTMGHNLLNQEAIIVARTLLPRLRVLSNCENRWTYLSLETLGACHNLRELKLYGNKFSEKELQRITAALPHTKLSF